MSWKRYIVPLAIELILFLSKMIFNHFDKDSDGKITKKEYNDKVKELKRRVRSL